MADPPAIISSFKGNYGFLSNFFPSPLSFEGRTYRSLEHAFQAAKTVDPVKRRLIAEATSSLQAKQLGRLLNPLRPHWDTLRVFVMYDLVSAKFLGDNKLYTSLGRTNNSLLIEGNDWHDDFWGNCTCEKHANVPGQNWLGRTLMVVREELR